MWKFEFDELAQTLASNRPALEWLTTHSNYAMAVLDGSVLAPNIPGADADGAGKLLLTDVGEGAFVVDSGVLWFIPDFWHSLTAVLMTKSGDLTIQLTDPAKILLTIHQPDSLTLLNELQSRYLVD